MQNIHEYIREYFKVFEYFDCEYVQSIHIHEYLY